MLLLVLFRLSPIARKMDIISLVTAAPRNAIIAITAKPVIVVAPVVTTESVIVVASVVTISSIVSSILSIHVGPGILIVRVPTTHINRVASLSIHTVDERNPEHFQIACQDQLIICHYAIEVAESPFYTLHSTWTFDIGFCTCRSE